MKSTAIQDRLSMTCPRPTSSFSLSFPIGACRGKCFPRSSHANKANAVLPSVLPRQGPCACRCFRLQEGALPDVVLPLPVRRSGHSILKASSCLRPHLPANLFRRVVQNDSCGFEHVFCGECDGREGVSGFHNWICFMIKERQVTKAPVSE